jgi:hypothetical protein
MGALDMAMVGFVLGEYQVVSCQENPRQLLKGNWGEKACTQQYAIT